MSVEVEAGVGSAGRERSIVSIKRSFGIGDGIGTHQGSVVVRSEVGGCDCGELSAILVIGGEDATDVAPEPVSAVVPDVEIEIGAGLT